MLFIIIKKHTLKRIKKQIHVDHCNPQNVETQRSLKQREIFLKRTDSNYQGVKFMNPYASNDRGVKYM